jgi:hypothetical protein
MNKRIQRAEELAKAFTNEELSEFSEVYQEIYFTNLTLNIDEPQKQKHLFDLMMTYELARSMQLL